MHASSSAPHVVHAMHAPGAQQQPACSSDVGLSSPASASASIEPILRTSVLSTKRASRARVAGGDGLGATCSRSGSYRSQPYRRWSDSGRHGRCIRSSPAAMGCHRTGSQAHLPPLGVMANRRVPRPRVRQSSAHSRHHLLGACSARAACAWCTTAARLQLRCRLRAAAHKDGGHRSRRDHFRRYRCSQRRKAGLRLVPLQFESIPVIAERPASTSEPLQCIWLRHLPETSRSEHHMTYTASPSPPWPVVVCRGRESVD